jgi:hypothetical protein
MAHSAIQWSVKQDNCAWKDFTCLNHSEPIVRTDSSSSSHPKFLPDSKQFLSPMTPAGTLSILALLVSAAVVPPMITGLDIMVKHSPQSKWRANYNVSFLQETPAFNACLDECEVQQCTKIPAHVATELKKYIAEADRDLVKSVCQHWCTDVVLGKSTCK